MSTEDSTNLNALVRVSAPARLHLGFLDLNGSSGRQFGSIGLAIDSHKTTVEIRRSNALQIIPNEKSAQLSKLLERFYNTIGQSIPKNDRMIELNLVEAIPEHAGFGSGTQLALVIATALCRLYAIDLTTAQIAQQMGRGARSGIGIATFDLGGLIVDGGSAIESTCSTPPVLAHHHYPENWRIVLIMDSSDQGVHGEQELAAFKNLAQFPLSESQAICHLTLMKLLPALVEQNINDFGASITAIQALIGDHFAPAQGGRYTSSAVAALLETAQKLDNKGIAQSSWGPTGCVFMENEHSAQQLIDALTKYSEAQQFSTISFSVVSANKNGAKIEIIKQ